jgi:hypothetical protein
MSRPRDHDDDTEEVLDAIYAPHDRNASFAPAPQLPQPVVVRVNLASAVIGGVIGWLIHRALDSLIER